MNLFKVSSKVSYLGACRPEYGKIIKQNTCQSRFEGFSHDESVYDLVYSNVVAYDSNNFDDESWLHLMYHFLN